VLFLVVLVVVVVGVDLDVGVHVRVEGPLEAQPRLSRPTICLDPAVSRPAFLAHMLTHIDSLFLHCLFLDYFSHFASMCLTIL
jgi:hypothetical protein